jgi:hypothetical protein
MRGLGSGGASREGVIDPRRRTARRAGAWYLLMGIGTAFGMGYVDPLLRASNDGTVTASTIRSSVALLHAGIAGTAIGMVAMLFLAGALYELFEGVDRAQARLLVVFVVAGVSITMLKMASVLVAIGLARGDGFALGLEPAHRIGLMMTFLAAYRFGGLVGTVFWGLWLLPFGLLLLRAGFAPRVLGVLMTIGCFAYLLHGVAELFLPSIGAVVAWGLVVPTLGEVGTIAWLLLEGPVGPRAAS